MTTLAIQLSTPPSPPRERGPESEGDGWAVYPHTDGGHELVVRVASGAQGRSKLRVPREVHHAR